MLLFSYLAFFHLLLCIYMSIAYCTNFLGCQIAWVRYIYTQRFAHDQVSMRAKVIAGHELATFPHIL